jgi:hypothetical protein
MSAVVIGVITFLIGIVVGAIGFRLITNTPSHQAIKQQLTEKEKALQNYQQEVAQHLESSAALLEQMHATCQTAMAQMAKSTQLLKQATPKEQDVVMPFFSEETQQQLIKAAEYRAKKAKKQPKINEITEQPPVDYPSQPSGLFADKTQNVTNSN